ncbi:helix-turn-helix domain-containing protein [Stakelama sp. CBK3Z-3]|uniref:Helix-turn-helix domain-containing protein n=1 Tax=Stakelama flava TaxID=2860338 RepID=A0ABS6XJA8_9SPHN|nr:helix-turn-helix domain-containing protein [Stakelama flava]MBW4330280.1 helix-turn-helix domain-containing protein [Stakelama flava]
MTMHAMSEAAILAMGSFGRVREPGRSGAVHRTGAPVRRDSIEAGTFEEAFFAVPGKGETDRLLRIARRGLDAGRRLKREARAGTRVLTRYEALMTRLTAAAVRIYEELLTLARLNRGRVYPSYDHLSEATGLARATVARCLPVLEALGLLVRQRRFRRVEGEGAGPRYAQTSNAYRPTLAERMLGYLPRWMRPTPVPDDHCWMRESQAGEAQAMLDALPAAERAGALVGGQLGKLLAKLGASIDAAECESQKEAEPLLQFNLKS